jgi:hypothetical protein
MQVRQPFLFPYPYKFSFLEEKSTFFFHFICPCGKKIINLQSLQQLHDNKRNLRFYKRYHLGSLIRVARLRNSEGVSPGLAVHLYLFTYARTLRLTPLEPNFIGSKCLTYAEKVIERYGFEGKNYGINGTKHSIVFQKHKDE